MSARPRVLLVDDREENLLALEGLLRGQGAELLKARSGREALELLLLHEVALAIIDVQMPEMDGFELAELMRGSERTREVPIVFVTAGLHDQARVFKGYESGAVDFLAKPLDAHILRSKVAVFLQLHRQKQLLAERVRELEAALVERRRAEDALRQADRRKNEFLAMLSHELRNPLAPIRNSLFVLDRTSPGGSQAKRAQSIISRQVAHLTRLVDDLLDLTRISRNRIELQREQLDLQELVARTVDDQRSLFEQSGIRLQLERQGGPAPVSGDRTRLAQVVANLLQNAEKFTEPGGSTRVTVSSEPGEGVAMVTVADTGVGIEPEMLPRLFEPFAQADVTLDRSKGGLGLGLALVKSLVELHGGEVTARSGGRGRGAEFMVRLPLDSSGRESPCADAVSAVGGSRRILVVEDNVDAAESLKEALELGGHVVDVAFSGPEGIDKARVFRPQVVLCDIGLPGLDGYQVARTLRADPELRGASLVALSGYALPEDVDRAREAGFDRHMAKPPDLAALDALLRTSPRDPAAR
jgi:signal transduction histidine kinase